MSNEIIQFITCDEAIAASKKEPGVRFVGIRFDPPYREVECYEISTDDSEDPEENYGTSIYYSAGLLFSDIGEFDNYSEEDVPAEAKNVFFTHEENLGKPSISDLMADYVLAEVLPNLKEPDDYPTESAFVKAAIREFKAFWRQRS